MLVDEGGFVLIVTWVRVTARGLEVGVRIIPWKMLLIIGVHRLLLLLLLLLLGAIVHLRRTVDDRILNLNLILILFSGRGCRGDEFAQLLLH